jgi:beta-N-acetylhexosaminidase
MLMLGFSGATVDSTAAQILASHIEAGRVAGVFFVRKNIGSREDVSALVRLFSARSPFPILTVIDHEGGAVQRLTESHGFTRLPSARVISAVLSRGAARAFMPKRQLSCPAWVLT